VKVQAPQAPNIVLGVVALLDDYANVPESHEAVASGVNKERHCLKADGLNILPTKIELRTESFVSSIYHPKYFRYLGGTEDWSQSEIAQASSDIGITKENKKEEVFWIPPQLLERVQSQISVLDFFPVSSVDSAHYSVDSSHYSAASSCYSDDEVESFRYSDDKSCYSDDKVKFNRERSQLQRILSETTNDGSSSDEDIEMELGIVEGGEQELATDTLMALADILAEEHKDPKNPSELWTYGEANKKKVIQENPSKQLAYQEADKKKKGFNNFIQRGKGRIRSPLVFKKLILRLRENCMSA
jgi:hypothetical protein